MKNVSYKKSQANKLALKGVVSKEPSGQVGILYYDDDGNEIFCDIAQCVGKLFLGQEVAFSVGTKADEDCTEDFVKDDFEED